MFSGTALVPLVFVQGCQPPPPEFDEATRSLAMSMRLPVDPSPSPSNRFADSPEAAELGRQLYFDTGLSKNGRNSCSTCHDPARGFSNGERVATMEGTGTRNVPTVQSVAWQTWFFWDGRADSAWSQAIGPILNPLELANTPAGVRNHLLESPPPGFETLFGPIESMDERQVLVTIGKSLEAFERTLRPSPGGFDQFVEEGFSGDGLSVEQQRGMEVFFERGCTNCHNGPLFTDHAFHNIGAPPAHANESDDGRKSGAIAVLESEFNCRSGFSDSTVCDELRFLDPDFEDAPGSFKTPTLRGVANTAPYFHNGSVNRLDEVVEFYDRMPGKPLFGHRDLVLSPLGLSDDEAAALVSFLAAL